MATTKSNYPFSVHLRKYQAQIVYLALISSIYIIWGIGVAYYDLWAEVASHWLISITMAFGSVVAGATAEGGGAVAFPVFTKLLHIPVDDAKTFGLMIQAVGMTMASIVIFLMRIPVLNRVIWWVSLGGIVGVFAGLQLLNLSPVYPRLLFTAISLCFGIALFLSRWVLKFDCANKVPTEGIHACGLLLLGFVGGGLVSQIGTGIDMLTFVCLVMIYGINEKRCIPTTVVIMAINAIAGFASQVWIGEINETVTHYWLAAVPVVIIGAPLGTYLAYKLNRDILISALLCLIALECISTLWIIPFTSEQVMFSMVVGGFMTLSFAMLLRYRFRKQKQPT